MPSAAREAGHEPDRQRHRSEACDGLAPAARQRSLRFGAPGAVVDPLLSLLLDIRRLEQRVLSILEELGVDRSCLPAGAAPMATASPPASPASRRAERLAQRTNAIDDYAELLCPSGQAHEANPLTLRTTAVDAVLSWLDSVAAGDGAKEGSEAATRVERVSSRAVLAALVAAIGEAEVPPLVLTSGPTTLPPPVTGRHAGQEGQPQREAVLHFAPAAEAAAATEGMTSVGVFDVAAVEGWGRYADGLSAAIAEMHPLLHSLCATTLASTRASHAKWVEVNRTSNAKPFSVPSCAGIKSNFESVIRASDAFAACQAATREHLLKLEEALEDFGEEAAVVCRVEEEYWRHVRLFEKEYNALRAMKRGVSLVQRAFRRAEGIPIHHTYKGHIGTHAEIGRGDRNAS